MVVWGFGFVHRGERDVKKERGGGGEGGREIEIRERRDYFRLYILLCKNIILMYCIGI